MKKILTATCLSLAMTAAQGQVVINEIMQSNIDCIMDDLNDFPDSWVELYNAGDEAVNLKDYSISDKDNPETAWQLPDFTLQPKAFRLVYCDKATDDWETYKAPNKRDALNWHAPFRIDSGKGATLFLFKGGEIVDQLEEGLKKQPAPNIAYGRKKDGGDKWGYQATPTPGAKNCGTTYGNKDILGNPIFSVPGKVVNGSMNISLELSLPEDAPEGTVIRYTTNGSEPTASSTKYTSPISIKDTKIVRAKLFCDGKLSPRAVTHSYLKMSHNITLPVFSIVTDDKYLNDPTIGIMVDGTYTYTGSNDWWGGSSGNEEDKNFFYNWRRPMNYEFFENEDVENAVINQLGEVRIAGGYTRRNALKTLCLYANKRFGEKRLKHEFFPDQRPGLNDFKSIMLRDAGNDYDGLYMRDAIIQRSMAKYLDLDWQAYRPAIVFVNGQYKGILNIRERSNEDNIYTNYNGLEDIDMLENPWVTNMKELKEGTWDNWNAFEAFYKQTGHTYAEYDELMDVQEFMNIMIFNSFFCNTDFPGNNIVFWRPQAEGSRWRVIVKDTDFGIGLYGKSVDTNYFNWLYNPSGTDANQKAHTELFRHLMDDPDFKREFIDRSAIYMGDFMNYSRVWETWEPMYEAIKDEYPYFRNCYSPDWWWWGEYNYNFQDYINNMNTAKTWLQQRTEKHYAHLNSYYKAGTPRTLTINKAVDAIELQDMGVEFNGWELSRGTFDGKFFQDRQVTLKGKNVKGWRVKQGNKTTEVEGSEYTFTMPNATVAINAIYADPTGIEQPKPSNSANITVEGKTLTSADAPMTVYTLQGKLIATGKSQLTLPHAGVYIVVCNGTKTKVAIP